MYMLPNRNQIVQESVWPSLRDDMTFSMLPGMMPNVGSVL